MAPTSAGRKLAFSLVVLASVFGLVEVVLRATTAGVGLASIPDPQVASHVAQEGLAYDPVLGWVREGLPDRHNGMSVDGFRHPDFEALTKAKPAGTWRAFTFGDSQTYGAGVPADQSYPAFTEQALRQRTGSNAVQVINAGLSGYGSLQALRLIEHKVLDWAPDLLIVDCFPYDQPKDFVAGGGPQLPGLQRLLFSWRTYYVLRFTIERSRGRLAPLSARNEAGDAVFAGNHDRIMQVAAQAGVPVVFLDYPFWRNEPGRDIECVAPAERLPDGAVIVPVCQALQRSGQPGSALFLDDNHMSAEGNRVAGSFLAQRIVELGLGPGSDGTERNKH